jgi:Tfp pilus assembly protein PilF
VKILYLIVFIVLSVAAGCEVRQPVIPTSERLDSNTSDTDASARGRARIHTDLAVNYMEIRNLGVALEEAGVAQRTDPTYGPAYNVAGSDLHRTQRRSHGRGKLSAGVAHQCA